MIPNKLETVVGIILVLFFLALFLLPAGKSSPKRSTEDALEIHQVIVPSGYDVQVIEK